jgi:hypothetical protein
MSLARALASGFALARVHAPGLRWRAVKSFIKRESNFSDKI